MRDVDGVEACSKGGVDVTAGGVPDHPSAGDVEAALLGKLEVDADLFLFHDSDMAEETAEAGTVNLGLLFVGMTLRE